MMIPRGGEQVKPIVEYIYFITVLLYLCLQKRHSVDQCSGEQGRARSDRATLTKVRTSPRGLSLSKLNLKGASETTVTILLQRKHQKGETKDPA